MGATCCSGSENGQDRQYYFFYGDLHPNLLAKLFRVFREDFYDRCMPAILNGWMLAFAGEDHIYKHVAGSMPTIVQSPEHKVKGYVCYLSSIESAEIKHKINVPIDFQTVRVGVQVINKEKAEKI